MDIFEKCREKVKSGRDTRLLNEWVRLHETCAESDEVSYTVIKMNTSGLPIAYEIVFGFRSITGVENADPQGLQKPIFGDRHVLRITLPNNYPAADSGYPAFKFVTDVWHPNVRYFGDFKGRVCLNFDDCVTSTYLADHVATIAGYLRYTDYHARNEPPYPEDRTVAQWTLEQAEPQGWTKFLITILLFSSMIIRGMAQEVNLNPDDDRNKQTVAVKLYDTNEGDFLLDLPLTFHVNADNILFMIIGNEDELAGNRSVWMFDKTVDLNAFLKQNKNAGTTKTFKKNNKELVRFNEQSENVERYVLFERGFERVQASPRPVFFQVKDPAKPVQLKLRFYVASVQRDGMDLFSSEAGVVKITVNIQ